MNDPARVLVLGGYSAIGREIGRGLLERTHCTLRLTGRDQRKLGALADLALSPRVAVSVLDATDRAALEPACRDADIVVNCVGPYIVNGYAIADTVVRSGRHYVDFAFEQHHYRRLQSLEALARERGVAVVTGAGESVGLSSVLCAHAARELPDLESVAIQFIEGTLLDAESGFSSFMNGALEPALDNQDYVDGRYRTARMGSEIVTRVLPEPYGPTELLADPSIDSLILPKVIPLKTVKNYFAVGMSIPFGFFALMRLLNPYRRRFLYALGARVVRRMMRRNYEIQKRRSTGPREPLLRVEGESPRSSLTIEIRFHHGFNGTAILPVLICGMLANREIPTRGLTTAFELIPPERLFAELARHRDQGRLSLCISGPTPR